MKTRSILSFIIFQLLFISAFAQKPVPDFIKPDIKLTVSSAEASSEQGYGQGIMSSVDGDINSLYHSKWDNEATDYFPITLTYNFDKVKQLDYFIYHPRQNGPNGRFEKVEVWYTTKGGKKTKHGEYDLKGSGIPTRINFDTPLKNPTSVEFVVLSGLNGFASCAEMEFYQKVKQSKDLDIFADQAMTTLKPGTSLKTINKISDPFLRSFATDIYENNYDKKYRVGEFSLVLDPTTVGEELFIGDGHSRYQHVTGVIIREGVNIIAVEGLKPGRRLGLIVPNYMRKAPEEYADRTQQDPAGWGLYKKTFMLENGLNRIDMTGWDGLAYMDYFTDTPGEEGTEKIKVHFLDADVNGYFDIREHDNNDWKRLLDNAKYPVMDAVGRHSQIAYPVEDLITYAKGDGVKLLNVYDEMVYKQHELVGLVKYNKVPNNVMMTRVNHHYYMFRDKDGVAFKNTTMNWMCDPDRVIINKGAGREDPCWGLAHEIGHVYQLRPYFNWGGLGETSNNMASMYVTLYYGNDSRLALQDTYRKAREKVIDQGISYLESSQTERLVPFWQLHLYFTQNGQPDFYPDLYEALRNTEKEDPSWKDVDRKNPAPYQLNFVKKASQVAGINLYPFFEKWGFMYVGELEYEDYGKYKYVMTQEMVDNFKKELDSLNLKPLDQDTLNLMISLQDPLKNQ